MILRKFPEHGLSPAEHQRVYGVFGRENVVTYAQAGEISYAEHTGPLSIKSTLRGQEVYEVDGVPHCVDETAYLVLNNDQPYASCICSTQAVHSFCVFFRDDLDREVLASLHRSAESLLDAPDRLHPSAAMFFQHLRYNDTRLAQLLDELRSSIEQGVASEFWLDEQCHRLLAALLHQHEQTLRRLDSLPALRHTTRVEIYRRLSRARDYLRSCFSEPLTLPMVAQVACLSPHHFLRLFKQVYGITPHQQLTQLRLQKAARLLATTDASVTEIYTSVGFNNASSFARLYKRQFGFAPRDRRPRK